MKRLSETTSYGLIMLALRYKQSDLDQGSGVEGQIDMVGHQFPTPQRAKYHAAKQQQLDDQLNLDHQLSEELTLDDLSLIPEPQLQELLEMGLDLLLIFSFGLAGLAFVCARHSGLTRDLRQRMELTLSKADPALTPQQDLKQQWQAIMAAPNHQLDASLVSSNKLTFALPTLTR